MNEYKKKPSVTREKRKHKAAKGEASSVITFPVIKAEDHKKTKIKGNSLTIGGFY